MANPKTLFLDRKNVLFLFIIVGVLCVCAEVGGDCDQTPISDFCLNLSKNQKLGRNPNNDHDPPVFVNTPCVIETMCMRGTVCHRV